MALDFDKLIEGKHSSAEALKEIKARKGYDPVVVEALREGVGDTEIMYTVMNVSVSELTPNMILADDIRAGNGFLLIGKGQEVTLSLSARLENFLRRGAFKEPIKVFVAVETPSYRKDSVSQPTSA